MFICVSPNPAIDKRLVVERLIPGKINRVRRVQANAGGKSAHVAMVLRALGELTHWIGPSGGTTGTDLLSGLRALGIETHPISARGMTRTNLEILDDAGTVTEILEPGEQLSAAELTELENLCADMFKAGGENATVIFSGSLPSGASPDLYQRLVAQANSSGCRTLLDTSGEPLQGALAAEPFFIKPNRDEAEALLGKPIESLEAAADVLRQILTVGPRSVALSLGAEGMLYGSGKDAPIYFAPALSLATQSTVGCGDAALAGFARSFASDASPEEAIRLAAACGSANCVADSPGAVRASDVEKYLAEIQVERLP